ncbi:MAG: hypothetical protein IB618_02265 [Candidatus Pacearchaeota archaeon]|nr:MAG: hypothetical protein IB618_02265 [Candidatus Pacearchaeota archaeon]
MKNKNNTIKIFAITIAVVLIILSLFTFVLGQTEIAPTKSTGPSLDFRIKYDPVKLNEPLNLRCEFESREGATIPVSTNFFSNKIVEIWWWGLDCDNNKIGKIHNKKFVVSFGAAWHSWGLLRKYFSKEDQKKLCYIQVECKVCSAGTMGGGLPRGLFSLITKGHGIGCTEGSIIGSAITKPPIPVGRAGAEESKVAAELQNIEGELIEIRAYKQVAEDIGRRDLIPRIEALETDLENYKRELKEEGEGALATDTGLPGTAHAIKSFTGYFSWQKHRNEKEGIRSELEKTPTPSTAPSGLPPKPSKHLCEERGLGRCQLTCDDKLLWHNNALKNLGITPGTECILKIEKLLCCAIDINSICSQRGADYSCVDTDVVETEDCKPNLCPGPDNIQCCITVTCGDKDGIIVKSREEETEKCLPNSIIPIKGLKEGEYCCKQKEAERERVKKPGTLGRLSVCIGRHWLWDKQNANKFIDGAKKHLTDAGYGSIASTLETIKGIEDPDLKTKKINEQIEAIVEARKDLAGKKEELGEEEYIEIDKELEAAQDDLQKSEAVFAMTIPEMVANILSCTSATIKAFRLTSGGAEGYDIMGSCSAEKPLPGTDACISCNEDPYRICTKERCAVLGTCIAVPTEKGDQYNCIPGECEELGLVGMNKGFIEWYINGELVNSIPAEISQGNIRTDIGEIPFNTKMILINLTTDKPAQCRWILDTREAEFSEMDDFEENYYPMQSAGVPGWQYTTIMLPGEITRDQEHRIFIKCNNACDIPHGASYDQNYVQFRLEEKPDQLPPVIAHIDPENKAVVNDDWKNLTATFWLDELGNCKYSDKTMNYTTSYEEMKYFREKPNENSSVIFGQCYPSDCIHLTNVKCTHCELDLDLSKGYESLEWSEMPPEMQQQLEENGLYNVTKIFNFMIRCEDNAGNIMLEEDTLSYSFMTMPGYNITVIRPEMDERTYDRQPEIEVTSEPRSTECKYKTYQGNGPKTPPSWDEMYYIDEVMNTIHQGRHNETLNATKIGMLHTLWARCRDQWYMEAINFTKFYTLLDEDDPIVIRMYHDTTIGDYLIIETDENSTCVYGTSTSTACNYNFSDGTAMTGNNETIHAAYWQLDHLYYIKCVDEWENYPGGSPEADVCTTIIDPFEVPPL